MQHAFRILSVVGLLGLLANFISGQALAAGRGGGRPEGVGSQAGTQHSFSEPPNQRAAPVGGESGRPGEIQRRAEPRSEPRRAGEMNRATPSDLQPNSARAPVEFRRDRPDPSRAPAAAGAARNPNSPGNSTGASGKAQASANFNRQTGSNASWYHGAWHGNWTPAWGQYPAGWAYAGNAYGRGPYGGLGQASMIGVGGVGGAMLATSAPWAFGYWGYTNPFYAGGPAWGGYNYSQPLAAAYSPNGPATGGAAPNQFAPDPNAPFPNAPFPNAPDPIAPNPSAQDPSAVGLLDGSQAPDVADVDPARDAFQRGDYKTALALTDQDLMNQPGDPVLHQFRALCEFALGDYQQAAAGVYSVLATGPGWDWTTLVNLYPSVDVYTQQLRALEAYSRDHLNAADARFLLAYHYLIQGYDGAAEQQFREVTRLQPNNVVAAQMFKTLTNPSATEPGPTEPAAIADQQTTPIDPAALLGHWTASSPDGAKFALDLDKNQQFVWQFGRPDKMSTIQGKYTLSGAMLVLEGANQQNLVGQLKLEAANRLSFRLPGGNPNDPGLTFVR